MLRSLLELEGIQVFKAQHFPDERGFLLQSYVRSHLLAAGVSADFCQAIQSTSRRGVVRGLHFQWSPPQAKLVRCAVGAVFDVMVDIRHGSPTLGDHGFIELTEENRESVWIPPGFAHGFMALEDRSVVLYECTAEWNPAGEGGILWNDPALAIRWPEAAPIVSAKDRSAPSLAVWLGDPRSRYFALNA